MNHSKSLPAAVLGLALSVSVTVSSAQQPAPATGVSAAGAAADVWNYKTRRLDRAAVDALLSRPQELVVIDVRRPDELTAKGSFPVYLNIQAKQIESALAYVPTDRAILTVSNHAHRAGAVGDVLAAKGFKVAGAAGSEDYEAQGGTAIVRVAVPARPATTAASQ